MPKTIAAAKTFDCENCNFGPLEKFIFNRSQRLLYCPRCHLYQKGILHNQQVYENTYHKGYERRRQSKIVTAKIRLGAVTKYLSSTTPRSLDIGCSIGATVEAARQLGWNPSGVDVSRAAVEFCCDRGLDCQLIDSYQLPFRSQTFDVVSSWHVIEHVESVTQTLHEWNRVLKPGGILVLETPDSGCLKARVLGPRYEKFWPSDHLYTFRRQNLCDFLERSGFEILPCRLIGRWDALPPHLSAYAGLYRGWRQLYRALSLCKSIEICCRKKQDVY